MLFLEEEINGQRERVLNSNFEKNDEELTFVTEEFNLAYDKIY
jgi:hypothetical protein